jgi:hypothetical protein
MRTFLEHWAGDVAARIRIVTYDEALHATELPLGTYIFSDLERLLPTETSVATLVWDQLHAAGARLLNHPTRTLRRYDLLTMLHEKGRNHFRVVRANDRRTDLRYPVFVREEADHRGSITSLLSTRRQLDEALLGAMLRGHRLDGMLVIEYCDTSEDGVFRKHSAFMVGDRVVPCHIDCSGGWMVKDTDIVNEQVMAEERHYVEANPHREWLAETFSLAGVDYGRIDYSLLRGAPQVWEINTNPMVILDPANYTEIHMPVKRMFADQIRPALAALDTVAAGPAVRIAIPAALIRGMEADERARRKALSRHVWIRRTTRSWPFQAVRRIVRPLWTRFTPLVARLGRSRSDSQ